MTTLGRDAARPNQPTQAELRRRHGLALVVTAVIFGIALALVDSVNFVVLLVPLITTAVLYWRHKHKSVHQPGRNDGPF